MFILGTKREIKRAVCAGQEAFRSFGQAELWRRQIGRCFGCREKQLSLYHSNRPAWNELIATKNDALIFEHETAGIIEMKSIQIESYRRRLKHEYGVAFFFGVALAAAVLLVVTL